MYFIVVLTPNHQTCYELLDLHRCIVYSHGMLATTVYRSEELTTGSTLNTVTL